MTNSSQTISGNKWQKEKRKRKEAEKMKMSTAPTREHQNQGTEGTGNHSKISEITSKLHET